MADAKISALPSATTPLAGTEVLPVVQGGVTDKVTVANLTAGRAVDGLSFTATGGTVTASTPVWNATQTWNAGGVTFTGMKFNVTDTASASGSLLLDLQVGGVSKLTVFKSGTLLSANALQADGGQIRLSTDVILNRDAANTLALRNGTAAQALNVYQSYTDASNYSRMSMFFSGGFGNIKAQALGSGTLQSWVLSGEGIYFNTGASDTTRWQITNAGHFVAATDNTYDIGASGANRPRNVYAGTNITAAGQIICTGSISFVAAATGGYYFNGSTAIKNASDGVLGLFDNAGTSFGRLQFGGTTSSFPALRRTATALEVLLADASNFAPLRSSTMETTTSHTAAYNTAITAGGDLNASFKATTTANFGVFFGSGAPTISAAKGSLYLRSDGSGVNDRMYVNTNGSTTWTAVVTVA